MQNKFYDFIKFDKNYVGKYGDFSGSDSIFSDKDRVDFLTNYSNFLCAKNDIGHDGKYYKVVEDDEILELKSKIDYDIEPKVRRRVNLKNFNASKYRIKSDNGWFYYSGAYQENGIIKLCDNYASSSACAKYEFTCEKINKISYSVYIPDDFINSNIPYGDTKPLAITSGRIVEFRKGVSDVLKLQFFPNGEVFIRDGSKERYHPDDVWVGKFLVNTWNLIEIVFLENTFKVFINGENKSKEIRYTNNLVPDTIFVSGGRYPVGSWEFKLEEIDGIYSQIVEADSIVEKIGEVELPYVFGSLKNKDCKLILSTTIDYNGGIANLHIGSLSPSGEVYVNGEKHLAVNNFAAFETDITEKLKLGSNEIQIVVFPRAPEVPYPWHRHDDPYNGWFCRDIYIDFLQDAVIKDVKIATTKILENNVCVDFSCDIAYAGKDELDVKILLAKSYPATSEEMTIYQGKATCGKFFEKLAFEALPWTIEEPVLYGVRVIISKDGKEIDDFVTETGFRTICQENGDILLNGKKIILTGGLIMQFLPPYEEIMLNHLCPSFSQILMQMQEIKKMNGNTARLHQLGYGTNDSRFASICDRLGVFLIWTTAYIDSLETVAWGRGWKQKDLFVEQIKEVINHPSIIMWEGSNEFHATASNFDPLFDEFVDAVKKVDQTRILCPCSHMYYGGGLYGNKGFYYQDDGKYDQDFNQVESSYGWKDPLVIRSGHTYEILLGYGENWKTFREQKWKSQNALFNSKDHAYIISEFAVIGRQDDTTPDSKIFINKNSYELPDETGVVANIDDLKPFNLSQAHQALCAYNTVKYMRAKGADGLLWCAMRSGANNGSYLKPPIDFQGYAKHAFFALKEGYANTICFNDSVDVMVGADYSICPTISGAKNNSIYDVTINVINARGDVVDSKSYKSLKPDNYTYKLDKWIPKINENGYYSIEYIVEEK